MVKARIPGSSQELYTVSVESVPQYAGGNSKRSCCKSGRVGKDLLCGVLIALAVICAAVAIFLVIFYVVNGTDANQTPAGPGVDQQNGPHDSSPLTRDREEEKKINSLKESHHEWDDHHQGKDHLSLSSTSLPDVGIHDPEFHGNGQTVYPTKAGSQSTTTTTTTSTTSTPSTTATAKVEPEDDTMPIVEAKSQDIGDKDQTTLFVPDDDVIIETSSGSVVVPTGQLQTDPVPATVVDPAAGTTTTTSTTVKTTTAQSTTTTDGIPVEVVSPDLKEEAAEPVPAPAVVPAVGLETSGFVPVKTQEDPEVEQDAQTEVMPDIEAVKPNGSGVLQVDTAPWKPIDGSVAIPEEEDANGTPDDQAAQGRFIVDENAPADNKQALEKVPEDQKTTSLPTTTKSATTVDVISTSSRPLEVSSQEPEQGEAPVQQEPIESPSQEPDDATEFALMQDLGNLALLVPEDRVRTSSSTGNPISAIIEQLTSTPAVIIESSPSSPPAEPQCIRRQLPFCRGVLPYSETVLPNWVGDTNEAERNLSVPYFEIIAESECHPRVQQYACAVLEPPCRGNGISLPPCRQFCRAIAEDCASYVLSALTLASVLDCDQFPQSNDPNVCLNLASTTPEGECLPNEYRCNNDNTCIPERWVCDDRQDCSLGDDEFSCTRCRDEEFRCETENRCLPIRWRCDGSRDCADGSDERDCPANQECGDGQFRCHDGLSCIPLRRVCDGSNHCRDNSDETNCTSIACQIEDFKCRDNGVCISRKWVCDGNIDCKDGSDETDCAREAELDQQSDILIDELEGFAGNETSASPDTAFNPEKCPLGELLCMSGSTCIRFEQLCDGTRDCADGADETDCSKGPE